MRDRLVQFKFLHRTYYTPERLHKIGPNISDNCWRFKNSKLTFIVTRNVESCLRVQHLMTPKVCLLGLVEETAPTQAEQTLIGI